MDLYEQAGQGLYNKSQQPPQRQRPSRRQLRMANIVGALADGTAVEHGNPMQGLAFSMPQSLLDKHQSEIDAQQERRRQMELDNLDRRNVESQIQDRVGGGGFEGTGIEAQMLNIALNPNIPDNDPRKILAAQRLGRSITTVTPQGTHVQDGYNLAALGGESSNAVPAGFTPKKRTDGEKKAGGYYDRMVNSQKEIESLKGFNPVTAFETVTGATNPTASKEKQRYRQAANDWIRAKLRQESGAVIADEEMAAEYRTYFPIFGDSPEVIAQKVRARKVAEASMREASGEKPLQESVDLRSKYGLNK